jgi:hypothetical protein
MERVGRQRLVRFVDSLGIILSEMGYEDRLAVKRGCKVGSTAVRVIAQELGVEESLLVLKVKELLT